MIEEIVRRVRIVAPAEKIPLFGSAATEQITGDSDIDLLVVEAEPCNSRKESVLIREALLGLGFPFDVIVIGANWSK